MNQPIVIMSEENQHPDRDVPDQPAQNPNLPTQDQEGGEVQPMNQIHDQPSSLSEALKRMHEAAEVYKEFLEMEEAAKRIQLEINRLQVRAAELLLSALGRPGERSPSVAMSQLQATMGGVFEAIRNPRQDHTERDLQLAALNRIQEAVELFKEFIPLQEGTADLLENFRTHQERADPIMRVLAPPQADQQILDIVEGIKKVAQSYNDSRDQLAPLLVELEQFRNGKDLLLGAIGNFLDDLGQLGAIIELEEDIGELNSFIGVRDDLLSLLETVRHPPRGGGRGGWRGGWRGVGRGGWRARQGTGGPGSTQE